MKMLLALIALVLAFAAYVRLAPSDPTRWHVDPVAAKDPGQAGALIRHAVPLSPTEALAVFDALVQPAVRTARLAGSVEEGRVTYVARSLVMGFPDYITATAVPTETGSELVILSRLRFGRSDLGVNRARLQRWLQQLPQA
ncbi:hypothetical protein AIOL_002528 [Candidatus Rhodobacter oscarellae]|uniref:DUF1499 domain-containing protein n=1 Tax=Candidatus Rhodobacter oscarellae TaxID=1675527 RepID=A0A0J9GVH6_9RHOB|nr:DUF1499 domain-containing protein [Candidatus Rhodobacter lobularis]KMW57563.1 hypothetical protein AIOL_002528 [Candidatus Rhodobacter lobularis]